MAKVPAVVAGILLGAFRSYIASGSATDGSGLDEACLLQRRQPSIAIAAPADAATDLDTAEADGLEMSEGSDVGDTQTEEDDNSTMKGKGKGKGKDTQVSEEPEMTYVEDDHSEDFAVANVDTQVTEEFETEDEAAEESTAKGKGKGKGKGKTAQMAEEPETADVAGTQTEVGVMQTSILLSLPEAGDNAEDVAGTSAESGILADDGEIVTRSASSERPAETKDVTSEGSASMPPSENSALPSGTEVQATSSTKAAGEGQDAPSSSAGDVKAVIWEDSVQSRATAQTSEPEDEEPKVEELHPVREVEAAEKLSAQGEGEGQGKGKAPQVTESPETTMEELVESQIAGGEGDSSAGAGEQ